jgi:hypothetical protein
VTTSRTPLDLDGIEARRQRAWLDDDAQATRALIANDVPDMLTHLRADLAGVVPAGTPEYRHVGGVDAANALAAQGWLLHSVVTVGDNIMSIMTRGGPGAPASVGDVTWLRTALEATATQLEAARAELAGWGEQVDRLIENHTEAGRRWHRDRGRALAAEAERDRLAEQVQRIRDLHRPGTTDIGLPASAEPRCVVCWTVAPCDTVAAFDGASMAAARQRSNDRIRAEVDGGPS